MFSSIDIWQILAGVAIFILGTTFMEESVRSLVGRRFKIYLKKQTEHKLRAVTAGTLFSSLLQSSSVVNLLVMSLVGAGVLQFANALALILGSNLGTVSTNWLLAIFGFGFQIDKLAFPIAAISGISLVFTRSNSRLYHWARLLLGLSFLFISLGFIKNGMSAILQHTNLNFLNNYSLLIFALAGFLITAVVQSSSATVALALSALYVDGIPLIAAMAIITGAETGSAVKLFLAAARGNILKKRIAWSNFLFNVVTSAIFLVFIHPLHDLIVNSLEVNNKLIALVLFQSFLNFSCILIFYPFIGKIAAVVHNMVKKRKETILSIHKTRTEDPFAAIEAMEADTKTFIQLVLHFCESSVHISVHKDAGKLSEELSAKPINEKYLMLKDIHGELHNFFVGIQNNPLSPAESERIEQLVSCNRNCLYAAKSIKDAVMDIDQLYNSSNDAKYGYYKSAREKIGRFCERTFGILSNPRGENRYESVSLLYNEIQVGYAQSLKELYFPEFGKDLNEQELSTVVNFNRETYSAFKSILFAVKDYILEPAEARRFDDLPGFIR